MLARNYFFSKMTAYDIKETMYKVQAMVEAGIIGTIPAEWTEVELAVHKESHVFSVFMWDLVYAVDFDPSDLMWCPINKCYVHIEWFFETFGVKIEPTPDECVTYDAYDLDFTDDSSAFSGITFDLDNLHDIPTIEQQREYIQDMSAFDLDTIGSFTDDDKENNI